MVTLARNRRARSMHKMKAAAFPIGLFEAGDYFPGRGHCRAKMNDSELVPGRSANHPRVATCKPRHPSRIDNVRTRNRR